MPFFVRKPNQKKELSLAHNIQNFSFLFFLFLSFYL